MTANILSLSIISTLHPAHLSSRASSPIRRSSTFSAASDSACFSASATHVCVPRREQQGQRRGVHTLLLTGAADGIYFQSMLPPSKTRMV